MYGLNHGVMFLKFDKSLRRCWFGKHFIHSAEGLNHVGKRDQEGLDLAVTTTGIGLLLVTTHLNIMVRSISRSFLKVSGFALSTQSLFFREDVC